MSVNFALPSTSGGDLVATSALLPGPESDAAVPPPSSAPQRAVAATAALRGPEALRASVRAASRRAMMVDLEALVRFVFPPELQHAMSTGRLLAFGFYGPLDADARLRSGHKGSHVVGRWELDTMCRQFEREDILQVYMPRGKSPSSLSEAEADELLAQADARLKVAKGKAMMRQVTPDEVRELFADLERDAETGLLNFHDMQVVGGARGGDGRENAPAPSRRGGAKTGRRSSRLGRCHCCCRCRRFGFCTAATGAGAAGGVPAGVH